MNLRLSVRRLFMFFDRLVLAAWAIAGGLALAQFPQFLAQYLQRLGGHIDEAGMAAKLYALPELTTRAAKLAAGLHAIEGAPPLLRLPAFLADAQWIIAREALRHYTPGMTFASEECYYLAAGALLGIVVYACVKTILHGAAGAVRGLVRKIRRGGKTVGGGVEDHKAVSG
jgi:hypothetical protein